MAAVAAYQRDRKRQKAYGRWEPYTDAAPAREHLRALMAYGIGFQRAARAAGLAPSTVSHLLYPDGTRPAATRVRHETACRLLAVRPSLDLLAKTASVDGSGTRRRLQALAAAGHALSVLAPRLGMALPNVCRLLRDPRVAAATARAVRSLYDELWDAAPDESTPQAARRAARARRGAVRRGWPLPLAWDDDTIDDPAAGPAEGWRRGLQGTSAGLAEDAAELMARGLDRNQAAERLGVKRDTLDTAIARARRAAEAARDDTTEERSHAAA
jgi:DNA-binding CsgD family transcriptional regulator